MVPRVEQQSPTIKINPKQHPPKRPPPFNSIILNLNATKYNLNPFTSMTGDLTEDNLRAIATPASTVALSVAPLVSSTPVESDEIPDDGTYYGGICFERLPKYTTPSSDLQNKPRLSLPDRLQMIGRPYIDTSDDIRQRAIGRPYWAQFGTPGRHHIDLHHAKTLVYILPNQKQIKSNKSGF